MTGRRGRGGRVDCTRLIEELEETEKRKKGSSDRKRSKRKRRLETAYSDAGRMGGESKGGTEKDRRRDWRGQETLKREQDEAESKLGRLKRDEMR